MTQTNTQITTAAQPITLAAAEAQRVTLWAAFRIREDESDEAADRLAEPAEALEDFIATTAPASLADVAVKLRLVLDRTRGLDECAMSPDIVTSLAQVLAFVETLTGPPVYPTRPTAAECEAVIIEGFREAVAASGTAANA